MTYSYLYQVASVQLDSNGNGQVSLSPQVGQYWLPSLVRVSTSTVDGAFRPYCAVYQGASTIIAGNTFVDDTQTGDSDTTSVVSGTVTQFGESITAQWKSGTPNDTATLVVVGASSDSPPNVGSSLPIIPGTRFAGHVEKQNQFFITDANGSITGPKTYPTIACQNIAGLYVYFNASTPAQLNLFWYADQALTQLIQTDTVTVASATGGSQKLQRAFYPVGPYLSIRLAAPSYPPLGYTLIVQSTLTPFMPSFSTATPILMSVANTTIAASTTLTVNASVSHIGWAMWQCYTSGTSWSGHLQSGDAAGVQSGIADRFSGNPPNIPTLVILPGGYISATITNSDASTRAYWMYLIAYPSYSQ